MTEIIAHNASVLNYQQKIRRAIVAQRWNKEEVARMLTTIAPPLWIIIAIAGPFLLCVGASATGLIVYTLVRRSNGK